MTRRGSSSSFRSVFLLCPVRGASSSGGRVAVLGARMLLFSFLRVGWWFVPLLVSGVLRFWWGLLVFWWCVWWWLLSVLGGCVGVVVWCWWLCRWGGAGSCACRGSGSSGVCVLLLRCWGFVVYACRVASGGSGLLGRGVWLVVGPLVGWWGGSGVWWVVGSLPRGRVGVFAGRARPPGVLVRGVPRRGVCFPGSVGVRLPAPSGVVGLPVVEVPAGGVYLMLSGGLGRRHCGGVVAVLTVWVWPVCRPSPGRASHSVGSVVPSRPPVSSSVCCRRPTPGRFRVWARADVWWAHTPN